MCRLTPAFALLFLGLSTLVWLSPAGAQSGRGPMDQSTVPKRQYVVSAEKAVVYSHPSLQSKALGEFRRGATIVPVRFLGEWAEIDRPDHGYIHLSSLVARDEKREEGGSFDLSTSSSAGACPREKELEDELRRKDDRIRELEAILGRQGGVRPMLPPREAPRSEAPHGERREPLGAVTPGSNAPSSGAGYDDRNMTP